MALLRLYDFTPMTLIQSQQLDDEFNQLVNLLNGTSTSVDALIQLSHATLPPIKAVQLGAGPLAIWTQGASNKVAIQNSGNLVAAAKIGFATGDPATATPDVTLERTAANVLTLTGQLITTTTATLSAVRIGSVAGDPSTLSNGDIWYNSSTNKFRARENGASVDIIPGGSGTVSSGNQFAIAYYPSAGTTVDDLSNLVTDASGVLSHATSARTSGAPTFYNRIVTPADTGLTASTETVGIQFGGNTSASTVIRQHATGALTTQREYLFVNPTYSFVGASTLTTAATVAIAGAPVAGTNATITNPLALWVQAGNICFGSVPSGTQRNLTMNSGNSISGVRVKATSADFLFYAGANTTGFGIFDEAAGLDRFYIDSNGLIGLGIFSGLGAQTHIVSGSSSRKGLRVDSAASPAVDIATFTINGTDAVVINSAGNLKINTTASLNSNNRLTVNHNESPQTDAAVSFRAGATNVRPLDVVGEASGSAGLFRAYEDNDATERFRISNDGLVETRAGNGATPSTDFISLMGTYDVIFSTVGNSAGSGDTDLHSKTIAADVLSADGDFLQATFGGTIANNANAKRLRVQFGGTTVLDTGSTAALSNIHWRIGITVIRISSSTVKVITDFVANSGVFTSFATYTSVGSLSFGGTLVLKVVGNGVSASDVVQEMTTIVKGPNQ